MRPIQPLLMVLLGLLVVACFRGLRSRLFHRLILLGLALTATVLIVVPDLSTRIAELAGVGRGVDLIMYLGFVGVAFALVVLYTRLRATEQRLTEVVRSIALLHAEDAARDGVEQTPPPLPVHIQPVLETGASQRLRQLLIRRF